MRVSSWQFIIRNLSRGCGRMIGFAIYALVMAASMQACGVARSAEFPHPKIPELGPVPPGPGCYIYSQKIGRPGGTLKTLSCLSDAEIKRRPPPSPYPSNSLAGCTTTTASGTAGLMAGPCALQSTGNLGVITNSPGLTAPYNLGPPIQKAIVAVDMVTYGQSSDSLAGSGAYSIQGNTNNFLQANGHDGWVQFTLQSYPSGGGSRLCAWSIDTAAPTTANPNPAPNYQPVCASVSPIALAAGVEMVVGGAVCPTRCPFPGLLTSTPLLYSFLSYTTGQTTNTVWAIGPDILDLSAGNWILLSGSIMGAGGASQLVFQGQAEVRNRIVVTSCGGASGFPTAWQCPAPPKPALSGQLAFSPTTGEGSNLTDATGTNWANAPPSTLACMFGQNECALSSFEIYPAQ